MCWVVVRVFRVLCGDVVCRSWFVVWGGGVRACLSFGAGKFVLLCV